MLPAPAREKGKRLKNKLRDRRKSRCLLLLLPESDRPSSWSASQSPQGHVPPTILWIIHPRTPSRSQRQEACFTRNYLRRRHISRLLFNPKTPPNRNKLIFPPLSPRSPPHRTIRDAEEVQVRLLIQFSCTPSYRDTEMLAPRAGLPPQRARQLPPVRLALSMILLKPRIHPRMKNARIQTKGS